MRCDAASSCRGVARSSSSVPRRTLTETRGRVAGAGGAGCRRTSSCRRGRAHRLRRRGTAPRCATDVEIVLVHDAARALAPPSLFDAVVDAVRGGHPAVVPGLPSSTPSSRSTTPGSSSAPPTGPGCGPSRRRRASSATSSSGRTPGRASGDGTTGVTDDAALVERLGLPVLVVAGDPVALKVTTPRGPRPGYAPVGNAVIGHDRRPHNRRPRLPQSSASQSTTSQEAAHVRCRPVALVTGGGSGIGAATAARLVRDGLRRRAAPDGDSTASRPRRTRSARRRASRCST